MPPVRSQRGPSNRVDPAGVRPTESAIHRSVYGQRDGSRTDRLYEKRMGEAAESAIGSVPYRASTMRHVRDIDRRYVLATDFDQTLSLEDSGQLLSDMLGIEGFRDKVAGLSRINLVQEGGELAYLLQHDSEFRQVRQEHLREVGRRIRLKANVPLLFRLLNDGIAGVRFSNYVITAAPEEIVQSALENILPMDRIFGTKLRYSKESGEIEAIEHVAAGHGKVAVLSDVVARLGISDDRVVYVGDGNSDIKVMLHVNHHDGFTISVSDGRHIAPIARRTVLSDDAAAVLVPILEDIAGWDAGDIRELFDRNDLQIQNWDKVRTDWVTIRESADGGRRRGPSRQSSRQDNPSASTNAEVKS